MILTACRSAFTEHARELPVARRVSPTCRSPLEPHLLTARGHNDPPRIIARESKRFSNLLDCSTAGRASCWTRQRHVAAPILEIERLNGRACPAGVAPMEPRR
jgi:hypothetical protein